MKLKYFLSIVFVYFICVEACHKEAKKRKHHQKHHRHHQKQLDEDKRRQTLKILESTKEATQVARQLLRMYKENYEQKQADAAKGTTESPPFPPLTWEEFDNFEETVNTSPMGAKARDSKYEYNRQLVETHLNGDYDPNVYGGVAEDFAESQTELHEWFMEDEERLLEKERRATEEAYGPRPAKQLGKKADDGPGKKRQGGLPAVLSEIPVDQLLSGGTALPEDPMSGLPDALIDIGKAIGSAAEKSDAARQDVLNEMAEGLNVEPDPAAMMSKLNSHSIPIGQKS